MAHYPEAKVILTFRDPEAWYTSISNTILIQVGSCQDTTSPRPTPWAAAIAPCRNDARASRACRGGGRNSFFPLNPNT